MIKQGSTVCTTQEAAKLLGMSVTSVQQLVESGTLAAWKTKGGHRRIPLDAVLQMRAANGLAAPDAPAPVSARTSLMVVEDDPLLRALYQARVDSWELPLDISFCDNGFQALIEIGNQPPDVLLADIIMQGIDGYEVVETVLAKPSLRQMQVALVSAISPEELAARGGVPAGVAFFPKPVPFDQLHGYLRACCAMKQRAAR